MYSGGGEGWGLVFRVTLYVLGTIYAWKLSCVCMVINDIDKSTTPVEGVLVWTIGEMTIVQWGRRGGD